MNDIVSNISRVIANGKRYYTNVGISLTFCSDNRQRMMSTNTLLW